MKTFQYIVQDEVGIHARPAGLLVKETKKFNSDIQISANGKTVDAKKLMAIMSLGAKKGAEITLSIEGEDEDAACEALEKFIRENL